MAENILKMASIDGVEAFMKRFIPSQVIVVDSMYCSMGRMVLLDAVKDTPYTYYDLQQIVELLDQKDQQAFFLFEQQFKQDGKAMDEKLWLRIIDKVKELIVQGPCMIHDTVSKAFVEKLGYTCMTIMITSYDMKAKKERAKRSPLYQDVSDQDLPDCIVKEDQLRQYISSLTNGHYGQITEYDLILNTDCFGRQDASLILNGILNHRVK